MAAAAMMWCAACSCCTHSRSMPRAIGASQIAFANSSAASCPRHSTGVTPNSIRRPFESKGGSILRGRIRAFSSEDRHGQSCSRFKYALTNSNISCLDATVPAMSKGRAATRVCRVRGQGGGEPSRGWARERITLDADIWLGMWEEERRD